MKTQSTHAAAAKAIRVELKKHFPLIKFSVKSRSFSGGDAIDVEWQNGPTSDSVLKLIRKYQYGHFDGMCDLYEMSNCREDIPQVKYVQYRREVSEDIKEAVFQKAKTCYAGWENLTSLDHYSRELHDSWKQWTARDCIYRLLVNKDLTNFNLDEIFKCA